MKKLAYLVAALGVLSIGLLAGCQKQDNNEPSTPPAAPEMTNAPSTNAPAQ